jgi:membrane-bound lytic murein transglycosylase B
MSLRMSTRPFFRNLFIFLALLGFVISPMLIPLEAYAQALSAAEQAALQAQLVQVEAEEAAAQKTLSNAQAQSSSLQRDILILDTKIKAAQLNIKAKNLLIQTLGQDITTKEKTIGTLEGRIDQGKESLAQIMRKTSELDDYSIPVLLLSQNTLTNALSDLDTFESVQLSLKSTFEDLRDTKSQTETEKNALDKRRDQEVDARAAIQQDQANIQQAETDRKKLLADSKNNEATYGQILAQKQAKAAQIRAALFSLRDTKAIPFEDALKYAQVAQKNTTIRPAFLLAIITQESNLGANVGSCYVTSLDTGDGVGKNTGSPFEKVMKSPRDTTPFKNITSALGRDWKNTPVSCPIGSASYYVGRGYGGAMGPAQFIPSTWMLFQDRITKDLGISASDPWNPEHAFVASALYLTDLGAMNGSYSGEIKAACSYYGSGGASCTYGKQVMAKAAIIQSTMIDPLQGL